MAVAVLTSGMVLLGYGVNKKEELIMSPCKEDDTAGSSKVACTLDIDAGEELKYELNGRKTSVWIELDRLVLLPEIVAFGDKWIVLLSMMARGCETSDDIEPLGLRCTAELTVLEAITR